MAGQPVYNVQFCDFQFLICGYNLLLIYNYPELSTCGIFEFLNKK